MIKSIIKISVVAGLCFGFQACDKKLDKKSETANENLEVKKDATLILNIIYFPYTTSSSE